MFDEIQVCLDGSATATEILPLAHAIAKQAGARLTLLNVVSKTAELASLADQVRAQGRPYDAQSRFLFSTDVAGAIAQEVNAHASAVTALTTHGRTAWSEAILGSVALNVIRATRQPVLLFRPGVAEAPEKISRIVAALDSSDFSERIVPVAVDWANALAARLILVQALPVAAPLAPGENKSDIDESAYLRRIATRIKRDFAVTCDWEVLHGPPADALCNFVASDRETLLALTTHARGGVERAMLGSVAAACVRRAHTPMLVYWPKD